MHLIKIYRLPLIQQVSDQSTGGKTDLLILQDKYGNCKGVQIFRLNVVGHVLLMFCLGKNNLPCILAALLTELKGSLLRIKQTVDLLAYHWMDPGRLLHRNLKFI